MGAGPTVLVTNQVGLDDLSGLSNLYDSMNLSAASKQDLWQLFRHEWGLALLFLLTSGCRQEVKHRLRAGAFRSTKGLSCVVHCHMVLGMQRQREAGEHILTAHVASTTNTSKCFPQTDGTA